MTRYGILDGLRIGEISDASKSAEEITITDDNVGVGWYYVDGVFVEPPPDDSTYMLLGTTWVQNQDTLKQRARDSISSCCIARAFVYAMEAIRDGKELPKEVLDFITEFKDCVC